MRQGWLWAVSIAAVGLLSGCGGKPAKVAAPTDVLVLEVGGQQPSLRASLVSMGRTVAPGKMLRPRSAVDRLGQPGPGNLGGEGGGDEGGGGEGLARQDPEQQDPLRQDPSATPPEPLPADPSQVPVDIPPKSEWVIVQLPKNETLIHLSRRYLGDGRRFGEIMEWNGWTEPDTRRLRDGQDVKIKRAEMR